MKYCMYDSRFISAPYLEALFAGLHTQARPFYAFLAGLPKEDFYILCAYDYRRRSETWRDPGRYRFTLPEFLAKAASFDPQDEFCIYFVGLGEQEEADSPAKTELLSCEEATVGNLTELAAEFMAPYCEKCLRAGTPFRLTPETVARLGLAPEDVAVLRDRVERCNEVALARLQAEYDALKKLDGVVL